MFKYQIFIINRLISYFLFRIYLRNIYFQDVRRFNNQFVNSNLYASNYQVKCLSCLHPYKSLISFHFINKIQL